MWRLNGFDVLRVERQIRALAGKIITMRKVFAECGYAPRTAGHLHAAQIVDEPAVGGRIFRMIRFLRPQPVLEPLPQNLVRRLVLDPNHLLPQFGASFTALAAHGLVFAALTLAWLSLVARAGALLRVPKVRRALDVVTGVVLVAFGARLATERR